MCRCINRSKSSGYNIRAVNLCNAIKVFEVQNGNLSENCVIPVYTETYMDHQHSETPILDEGALIHDIRKSSLLDGQRFVLADNHAANEYRKVYGRHDMYVWNKSMTFHMGAGAASAFVVCSMCIAVIYSPSLYSMWHVPVSVCAAFSILSHAIVNAIQLCILPLQISCFFNKLSWELIMNTDVYIATYMMRDPECRTQLFQIKKPVSLMSSNITSCKALHFLSRDIQGSNFDYTHFERDTAFKRAKYVENMSIKTHNKINDEYMNVVGYSVVGILLLSTVTIASNFTETSSSLGKDATVNTLAQAGNITNIFFGAIFAVMIQILIAVFKAASHAIVSADLYLQSGWLLAKSNGLYHTNNKRHYVNDLSTYKGSLLALFINHEKAADRPYLVTCIGPEKNRQNSLAADIAQRLLPNLGAEQHRNTAAAAHDAAAAAYAQDAGNVAPPNAATAAYALNAEDIAPQDAGNVAPPNAATAAYALNAEDIAPQDAEQDAEDIAPQDAEQDAALNAEDVAPQDAEQDAAPDAENVDPQNATEVADTLDAAAALNVES